MLIPLAPERARAIVAGFPHAHVLIVGDAMLDKFIAGRVTRISPEAPVPVVMFDHESYRLGGAANVAHNIAALGARATLIAIPVRMSPRPHSRRRAATRASDRHSWPTRSVPRPPR
jgi:hypothetical protein